MTKDEAINNILSLCKNGTYHEWTVTDPDCLQMRRNLPSGEYQFIELLDCPSGGAIVVSSTIDLSDYSEGELWFYGSPYYESQSDFEAQGADIAAECVFEQRGDLADVLRTCETPESIVPIFLQILNSPAFCPRNERRSLMQYDSDYEKITLTKVHDELSRVLTAYETGETEIPIGETDLYELCVWTQNQLAGLLN